MEARTNISYQTFIDDFINDILVTCPKCSEKAIVRTDDFSFRNYEAKDIKVVCTGCGYNKILDEKPTSILYSTKENVMTGSHIVIGSPIDPFFYLPLWLKESVRGNILWAYNYEHLSFIKEHVESKLRERNGQEYFNRSLGSRLPKWMTSKNNRQEILKAIEKLKEK